MRYRQSENEEIHRHTHKKQPQPINAADSDARANNAKQNRMNFAHETILLLYFIKAHVNGIEKHKNKKKTIRNVFINPITKWCTATNDKRNI